MVSTIITTYGRKYNEIEATLKSVINQTYVEMELIVVDDNGKGSTLQLQIEENLKKLKSKIPVVYLPNRVNCGAQISRNKGVLAARGDYVALLDDDDLWEKDKVEKQMELFSEDSVGLVFCKGWLIDTESNKKTPYNMSENFIDELSFDDLSYGDYIGTTSQVLIKKDVFSVCGLFDVNQPARQDYEMWIRISDKYRCRGVNEYLFSHIQHKGEQISKNPQKAATGIYNIYRKYRGKCSLTSRWHLLWLSYKAQIKVSFNLKALQLLIESILFLFGALICDLQNFKYRIAIHNDRIKR